MTDKLLCIDQSLFDVPLQENIKLSTNQLEHFIAFPKPIIQESRKQAKKKATQTKKINKYMTPQPIPTHIQDIII